MSILTGYHFRVDFNFPDGWVEAGFQKVSGIGAKFKLKEKTVGGEIDKTYEPEGREFTPLVLERGMVASTQLFDWFERQLIIQKKIPLTVVVSSLDADHMPAFSWVFVDAYPIEFNTSGFDASKSGYLLEKITLRYWFYKQQKIASPSFIT